MRGRVKRFTRSERFVHWLVTAAFFSMLVSGLLVGRRGTFHTVMYSWHLASAGVLLGGIGLALIVGNRRALRRTVHELDRFDSADRDWLMAAPSNLLAHTPTHPPSGPFNVGQKLNFVLVCILLLLLYVSGIDTIIYGTHHNLIFGGHKLLYIALSVLVVGHIFMAAINPGTRPALRGMLTGEVDSDWAKKHYPNWKP